MKATLRSSRALVDLRELAPGLYHRRKPCDNHGEPTEPQGRRGSPENDPQSEEMVEVRPLAGRLLRGGVGGSYVQPRGTS